MKINWTVKLKSDPGLLLLRSIGVVEAILEYYHRVYIYIQTAYDYQRHTAVPCVLLTRFTPAATPRRLGSALNPGCRFTAGICIVSIETD